MIKLWTAFAVLCTPLLSACSTELMYNLIDSADRDQCLKLPDPARSNCLNQKQKRESYDQYKKKHDELMNGTKSIGNS